MSGTSLIALDAFFVLIVITIYLTDGFNEHPIMFKTLVSIAFATCVIRHINHYRITKRIY